MSSLTNDNVVSPCYVTLIFSYLLYIQVTLHIDYFDKKKVMQCEAHVSMSSWRYFFLNLYTRNIIQLSFLDLVSDLG